MDEKTELVRDAIYWRGMFIHRYSGVEFTLADLVARCSIHEAYLKLGPTPWGPTKKLKRFRRILEMPGPIIAYSDRLVPMVERFEEFEPIRHFMAHALMIAGQTLSTLVFEMHDHMDGEPSIGRLELEFDKLRHLSRQIQPISTEFTALVARIYREQSLPEI